MPETIIDGSDRIILHWRPTDKLHLARIWAIDEHDDWYKTLEKY